MSKVTMRTASKTKMTNSNRLGNRKSLSRLNFGRDGKGSQLRLKSTPAAINNLLWPRVIVSTSVTPHHLATNQALTMITASQNNILAGTPRCVVVILGNGHRIIV
jgi:hypothetical protein